MQGVVLTDISSSDSVHSFGFHRKRKKKRYCSQCTAEADLLVSKESLSARMRMFIE